MHTRTRIQGRELLQKGSPRDVSRCDSRRRRRPTSHYPASSERKDVVVSRMNKWTGDRKKKTSAQKSNGSVGFVCVYELPVDIPFSIVGSLVWDGVREWLLSRVCLGNQLAARFSTFFGFWVIWWIFGNECIHGKVERTLPSHLLHFRATIASI